MILIDLNVILDVAQERAPHVAASARVLETVVCSDTPAMIPAHAVTTIHYLVSRYRDREVADRTIDWLLRYFAIADIGRDQLFRARVLGWPDFEDAVVAASAENAGCDTIVTRNIRDFSASPVPACTPEEFLNRQQT